VETIAGHNMDKIQIPHSEKEILRNRAQKLAQRKESFGKNLSEGAKFLELSLAGEIFAVEIKFVKEVYSLRKLIEIPCTPSFVRGVTNLRGQILSVIDLMAFLGLETIESRQSNKVIVVSNANMELGILCEEIVGVRSVSKELIRNDVPLLAGAGQDFFLGLTDKGVVVLNLEKIMSDERIIVYQEVPE
jgi:purine-binding chemotaxis protein CheW